MTSKNSSFLKTLRSAFRLRHWPTALCLLLFFLNNIVGLFLFLGARNEMDWTGFSALYILRQKEGDVLSVLGGNSGFTPILAGALGIILAVQGFSWMNSRREIDFYESQPVRRKDRFFAVVLSGIVIYLGSCLVTCLLGAAIAAGMGVMSGPLFSAILYEEFRSLILFIGMYFTTVLAMTLCGSTLIALLAAGTLLIYEPLLRLILSQLRRTFFATYCDYLSELDPLEKPMFSAAAYYLQGAFSYAENVFLPLTAADVASAVKKGMPADIRSLILSAVILCLAYFAFRRRKNESAGTAVVFAPVRSVVKVLIAIAAALAAGLICYGILGQHRNADTLIPTFVMIIFFACLACCIMEIIYHFCLKDLFRNPAGIAVSAALSVFVFSFFAFDLSGFDRYLPKKEDVLYACAYPIDNSQSYLRLKSDGSVMADFDWFVWRMQSEDIDSIEKLSQIGIENSRIARDSNDYTGHDFVVCYRMKSGKQVVRRYRIPPDADETVLNAVLGSDAYRSTAFQLDGYPFAPDLGGMSERSLTYSVGYDSRQILIAPARETVSQAAGRDTAGSARADSAFLQKFVEAYSADLQHYNYTVAHNEIPVGIITLQGYYAPEDAYQSELRNGTFTGTFTEYEAYLEKYRNLWNINQNCDYTLSYLVYPEFTQTIAFLQEAGIYLPMLPDAADVASATVYRYPDTTSTEYTGDYAYSEPQMTEGDTVVSSDPEEIRQILEKCVCTQYSDPLFDQDLLDSTYSVELRLKESYRRSEDTSPSDMYWSEVSNAYGFLMGQVPAFLEK